MQRKPELIFTGVDTLELNRLQQALNKQGYSRIHADFGVGRVPEIVKKTPNDIVKILILALGEPGPLNEGNPNEVLNTFPVSRLDGAALVVVGPEGDMSLMRKAMQIGARDYIPYSSLQNDIFATLDNIVRETSHVQTRVENHEIYSVINSKGGGGASFVAGNLAHIMVSETHASTALVDMDFQFGIQCLNFDVAYTHPLHGALNNVDNLDSTALKGYMTRHNSGLFLLGEKLDDVVLSSDIDVIAVERMMALLKAEFDYLFIDLPRQIDPIFSTVIGASNHIIIVTQQSVAHIRDTQRLLNILRHEFELEEDQITVLVNRYNDKSLITIAEIQKTVGHENIKPLVNDYKRVVMSVDTATPIAEYAPTSVISRQLKEIVRAFSGEHEDKKSFFRRALGGMLRNQ